MSKAAATAFEKRAAKLAVENVLSRIGKNHPNEVNHSSSGTSNGGNDHDSVSKTRIDTMDSIGGIDNNFHDVSSVEVYENVKKVLVSYASHEQEQVR